mgnify:CR=1 FL=1
MYLHNLLLVHLDILYEPADTVRPALQLIKTKPGNKIVSSCFILVRPAATGENEVMAMGDCDNLPKDEKQPLKYVDLSLL